MGLGALEVDLMAPILEQYCNFVFLFFTSYYGTKTLQYCSYAFL